MKFHALYFHKRFYHFLISLVFFNLLSACTATYYSANSQNVPLMKEQGDIKIQGGVGGGEEANKMELQVSGSPVDHFALMLNYAHYSSETENLTFGSIDPTEGGEGALVELGAGYYGALPNKMWVYECYAGFGRGYGENIFSSEYTSFKLDRLFIQPNFGFSSDFFDAIFSVRGAYLNYRDVRQFSSDPQNPLNARLYQQGYFMLEPSLTIRTGYKFAKAQFQVGYSGNLTHENFPQDHMHVSFMLMVDLRRAYFKDDK